MRILTILLLLLLGTAGLQAQSDFEKGMALLVNNQTRESISVLEKIRKGPDAAGAAQALAFARAIILDEKGGMADFYRFVELEQDAVRRNAFMEAVWSVSGGAIDADAVDYMEKVLDNDYSRLRPLALYELGKHYSAANDLKKSRDYYAQLGMPAAWQITGSFENISESGFDQDFGVLAQPGPDASFTNKNDVAVTWFPVRNLPETRWLYFNNHLTTGNSVVYAQTFVTSPAEQEVVFRLGTSGSAKVWVNDQLAFSEATERDNHLDTYLFKAPLQAGNNRILVQIGASDRTGSNFLLRLTDDSGKVLEGLTFSDVYQPYAKGKSITPVRLENPTEKYFQQLVADGTADFLAFAALGQYYTLNGFFAEARKTYLSALDKYPNNLFLFAQLANALEGLDDNTNASAIYSHIKENFPESPLALNAKMSEAKSTKDWTTYESLLNRYEELYGKSELTLANRVMVAGNRKQVEEAIRLIEQGVKEYPESWDFASGMAKVLGDIRSKPQEVYPMLNKFLERRWDTRIVEDLITRYYNEGKTDQVISLFDRLIERNPVNASYYSRLSRLHYLAGRNKESREMLNRALLIAPYSNGLYNSMGNLYREGGDEKAAAAAYERALELNSYDYDSRDALRDLRGGESTAFSIFEQPDYYQIFAGSPGLDRFPDDNSLILNYDVQQIIYPGGASEIRSTVLIKALTTEGVDQWKEYTVGLYGDQQGFVEKVEVLDPDGSRHEGSRSGKDIVFDNLKVGGAIYLSYRIKDYQYGRLATKFWQEHPFTLSYPIQQSTYSLLVPAEMKFNATITGHRPDAVKHSKSKLAGKDLYVWESQNQEAVEGESTMVPFEDVLTYVRVSNIEDWAFIANWYSELTHAKIRPDDYVRDQVDELFAGKSGLSEREEVEIIYEFVVRNIRYISVPFLQSNYIPQTAGKTLATGQGDCKDVSSLFVAMCDLRGIDANLVLINTRDRSREALSLPGTGFNHCIARVNLDDKEYYVELTDENLPFGTGDWSVNDAFGVVIPRQGEAFNGVAGLINPASRGENQILRKGRVTFSDDDITLSYENRRVNSVATTLRSTYRNESPSNQEKAMLESVADEYPQVELLDFGFDDSLDDLSNELVYNFTYQGIDVKTRIGGMDIYEVALSDRFRNTPYISTAERTVPIDLWQMFAAEYYEQEVDIVAPEGKKVVEIPVNTTVSNAYFDYQMVYEATDEGLRLKRTFRLQKDIVPASDYAAFRKDMLQVVEADKVTLAFR